MVDLPSIVRGDKRIDGDPDDVLRWEIIGMIYRQRSVAVCFKDWKFPYSLPSVWSRSPEHAFVLSGVGPSAYIQ
ncbi:hypothetical protein V1514DRAFT_322498 [Lipomyces japonicus]|uniref:uncharacterized protein n=1 Tax=Lipomyces japonicus TaxID=56871 RepID=UPI0034CF45B0